MEVGRILGLAGAGALIGAVGLVLWLHRHPPPPQPAMDPTPADVRASAILPPAPPVEAPPAARTVIADDPGADDARRNTAAEKPVRRARSTERSVSRRAYVEAATNRQMEETAAEATPQPEPKNDNTAQKSLEDMARNEEAMRVLAAIERVNRAPVNGLAAPIRALREVPSTTPEIAAVRDLCVQLYVALAQGIDLHDRTAQEIARREKMTSSHEELAALHEELARADAAADTASHGIDGCVRGVRQLRTRYELANDDRR
jgi:hypothetical protein